MKLWTIDLLHGVADVRLYSPFNLGPLRLRQLANELIEAAYILEGNPRATAESELAPTMAAVRKAAEERDRLNGHDARFAQLEETVRLLAKRIDSDDELFEVWVRNIRALTESASDRDQRIHTLASDGSILNKIVAGHSSTIAAQGDTIIHQARAISESERRLATAEEHAETAGSWAQRAHKAIRTASKALLPPQDDAIIDGILAGDAPDAVKALREFDEKGGTSLDNLEAELARETEERDTRPVRLVPDAGGLALAAGTYCAWFENGAVVIEARQTRGRPDLWKLDEAAAPWVRFVVKSSTPEAPTVWFEATRMLWAEPYTDDDGRPILYAGIAPMPDKRTIEPQHTGISG